MRIRCRYVILMMQQRFQSIIKGGFYQPDKISSVKPIVLIIECLGVKAKAALEPFVSQVKLFQETVIFPLEKAS